MSRLPVLAVAVGVLVAPVLSVLPSAAALAGVPGAVCEGRPATIVGAPGARVRGTDGPDVIVASGEVLAGAGDDVVCTTGTRTYAGDGDDLVVSVTLPGGYHEAFLGNGDDTYRGGAGTDHVNRVSGMGVAEYTADRGADTIGTGAGDDFVQLGSPRGPAEVERVDLGSGEDGLGVEASGVARGSRIDLGADDDVLLVQDDRLRADRLAVDLQARTVTTERGVPLRGWTSAELVIVSGGSGGRGQVAVLGSERADRVQVNSASLLRVDLGAGDDELEVWENVRPYGRADLGAGRDRFVLEYEFDDPVVDLSRHRYGSDGPRLRMGLFGIEDVTMYTGTVIGNAADNRIELACGTANAGGGDDVVQVQPPTGRFGSGCAEGAVFRGGSGVDVLGGGVGPDVLVGGDGPDTAVGGDGDDACDAEVELGCEV